MLMDEINKVRASDVVRTWGKSNCHKTPPHPDLSSPAREAIAGSHKFRVHKLGFARRIISC